MRLGNWLSPSFSNFNPLAVDLLVARAVDKRVVDVTFRQMAENFGLDHSTYAYALKRARRTGTLAFCPACGSQVISGSAHYARYVEVTAGTLDNPEAVAPDRHVFWPDRLKWVTRMDGLPCHVEGANSARVGEPGDHDDRAL